MTGLRGRSAGRDRGAAATLYFAAFAAAWVAMFGSVIIGGSKIRHLQLAENIASEAARAGGQTIRLGQAVQGGPKVIDFGRVDAAVDAYLDAVRAARPTLTITSRMGDRSDTSVEIIVEVTYPLPAAVPYPGSRTATATGKATATLLFEE